MKKYLIALILVCLGVTLSEAQTTRYADSCGYADVKTRYDQSSAGDTIIVPAGSCNWGTSTLTITKAIILQGAGAGSSGTCNDAVSTCVYGTAQPLNINVGSSGTFSLRITGFHFKTSHNRIMDITGGASGWRIDNNYFYYTAATSKAVVGITANSSSHTLYGLLDGNVFKNVYLYFGGGSTAADNSWKAAPQWGTNNAVFVENNHFDHSDRSLVSVAIDSQNGGRFTVRYNIFDNVYIMAHAFQQASVRGARSYEIYNNYFRNIFSAAVSAPYYAYFRAGSAVVAKNVVAGLWSWSSTSSLGHIGVDNRRSWFDSYTDGTLGRCDGTNTLDMNIDPNPATSVKDGYRCADQPGAGTQEGTYNQNPTYALDPIYVWDNSSARICKTGTDAFKTCASNGDCANSDCIIAPTQINQVTVYNNTNNSPKHLVAGREWYDTVTGSNERPEYTPYTCPHPLADPDGEGSCDSEVAGTTGYSLTGGVTDTTPPTVTSFYIYSGTTVINFSEVITATSGAAFTVAGLASAMTLTCPAVETAASSMTCTNSRTVYQAEGNGTYGYTGTKVIDAAENQLATIDNSPTAVNLSTEVEEPPAVRLTVNKTGSGCTITSSPSGIIAGTTTTADYDTGTVVTLGGYVENGWNPTIVWGGDCASNGTVTMSSAKTCTATCTEKKVLKWAR